MTHVKQNVAKFFAILILLFSCNNKEIKESDEEKNTECIKEQQRYYDRIPDAPIDLYGYVDNLLETDDRFEICTKIYNRNLTAELGISIKDNKVDTVEMLTFYFDENDNLQKDTSDYSKLHKILNAIDKQNIPTFKFEKDGDFALRLQLERFCIGHVKIKEVTRAKEAVEKGTLD